MEVEEEATAAAAAAWLSPELATAATPPTPARLRRRCGPLLAIVHDRAAAAAPRRRPSPQLMEAPALASPTLAEEPPSQPAPVELPETPVEEE